MRAPTLTVETEEWDGTPVIRAIGEIDLMTVDAFRSAASEAVRRKPEAVIFDLRRATYIDSTGLGVLVATWRHLQARPEAVILITEQPAVIQALRLTGLDQVLTVLAEPIPALSRTRTG